MNPPGPVPVQPVFATEVFVNERQVDDIISGSNKNNDDDDVTALREPLLSTHPDIHVEPGRLSNGEKMMIHTAIVWNLVIADLVVVLQPSFGRVSIFSPIKFLFVGPFLCGTIGLDYLVHHL